MNNATTVERIMNYVETGDYAKAEALAALADYLEECALWDVSFDEE